MKRPTSEYSRIAKGLGDLNPRYKFDNILQLDLDMPERTTEDYEGQPSAKVQQAIQAILNDNDALNPQMLLQKILLRPVPLHHRPGAITQMKPEPLIAR